MDRVLILDGMWNKSLAAVRSFGRKGFFVTAGERTRLATALFSRYCNKRFIYPSPSAYPEDFLHVLVRELKTGNYDVIFPMEYTTQILLTETANRERLQRYARIPFADAELARKVNDKAFLMRYANEKGIDIPKTYFVNEVEEIEKIKDSIKCPVVIKPRVSSGSRGIVYAGDKQELIPSYFNVHEKYSLPIIQECIPGDETYGVGLLLNFQSEVRAPFVYKRLRTYPVNGGPSTLRESVKRDDIRWIAESLMRSLGWTGIAHVEFKIDPRDGRPKLLEVNPRFWGSLQLAIESGVDFPFLLYKMAVDGDIEPVRDYHAGVKCRWLLPGDILHFFKNPDRFRLKPNFFDFRVKDDVISWHDPMPTFGRILSAFTFIFDKDMRELLKR
ncbi:MAG: ATP-grasp domain-containing protein [Nitrospirae bacterium]|nr:ATP-grasp domain-containing protein [Nitrospirota bacterium]